MNPSILSFDGGINNGTSNVMIRCKCINTGNKEIQWYYPDKKEITFNYAEDSPYLIQESGTLIFPIFNDSNQGTYYCGVGNDLILTANISLTLWTGMYVIVMCSFFRMEICILY